MNKTLIEFLKAQASSFMATLADYAATFVLHHLAESWFVYASIVGNICGGIVNFLLGRYWAFSSKEEKVAGQAAKYLIVWLGNILLNAGGIYLLTEIFKLHPWLSKLAVSMVTAIGYNYVLQKFFVFKKKKHIATND
ncbi:MAG: GtrA family protein [Edaphocola sp.]